MDALWILLVCALPILSSADPVGPAICSSYGRVLDRQRRCAQSNLPSFDRDGSRGIQQLGNAMATNCINAQSYFSCMDNAMDKCGASVKALLSVEVRNSLSYCYGDTAVAFRDDFAPLFDDYNQRCSLRPETFRNCTGEMNRFRQHLPLEGMSQSIEQGIEIFRGLKSDFLVCVEEGMRGMDVTSGGCAGTAWQKQYVTVAVQLWGLAQQRPLGVYLDDTDIATLKALLEEVDESGSVDDDFDDLELLVRGLFR